MEFTIKRRTQRFDFSRNQVVYADCTRWDCYTYAVRRSAIARLLAVWFLVFIQPCSERSEHSCGLMALCALGARDLDSLLRNCERFGGGHLSDYWPKRRSRRGGIGSSDGC